MSSTRRHSRFLIVLLLAGCGPTKEDWKLAPPIEPGKVNTLQMIPDHTPATLPSLAPTTRRATTAPTEAKLRISDIRNMALRNNLDLKTTLYSPKIAHTNVSQEEAKFESTFFTNVRANTNDPPPPAGQEGVPYTYNAQSANQSVDPGITMPLRTGGSLQFSSPYSRYTTPGIDPQDEGDLQASISQPLLRNAGQETSEYSIRIAGYQEEITRLQSRLQVTTVLATVDRTYWRLYAARKLLAVRKQQYDLAQQLLEKARRMVAAGQSAQIEITRAESGVADQLDAIISAEDDVDTRERDLKRLLNEPDYDDSTVLVPTSDPNPVHYAVESQHLIDSAMRNRSELLQAQLRLSQDALTIGYAKNQMLPLLSANYTYRIRGLGSNPSDAYDMTFQRDYQEHSVGLNLEIPLGNEAAKAQLRRALLQRQQDLATKGAQALVIRTDVLNAIGTLNSAWLRIVASRSRTVLAARALAAEQHQFDLGLRTATDVLDAQTKLADAQASEISALTDYEIAQIDLAFATGTILGQAKVDWEKQIPEDVPTTQPSQKQ